MLNDEIWTFEIRYLRSPANCISVFAAIWSSTTPSIILKNKEVFVFLLLDNHELLCLKEFQANSMFTCRIYLQIIVNVSCSTSHFWNDRPRKITEAFNSLLTSMSGSIFMFLLFIVYLHYRLITQRLLKGWYPDIDSCQHMNKEWNPLTKSSNIYCLQLNRMRPYHSR